MNRLASILPPAQVLVSVDATSKKRAFEEAGLLFENLHGLGRALIAEAERIGTDLGAAFTEITAAHHRPEARHLYESLGYDATVTAYLRKKL